MISSYRIRLQLTFNLHCTRHNEIIEKVGLYPAKNHILGKVGRNGPMLKTKTTGHYPAFTAIFYGLLMTWAQFMGNKLLWLFFVNILRKVCFA